MRRSEPRAGRATRGFSLLEVVIVTLILTLVLVPLFNLFSLQRQEVSWANQEVFVHAYAIQRLAEEEARITVALFDEVVGETTREVELGAPGQVIDVTEVLSIEPLEPTSALWKLSASITWRDVIRRRLRSVEVARLVVNREVSSRLPLVATPWARAGGTVP